MINQPIGKSDPNIVFVFSYDSIMKVVNTISMLHLKYMRHSSSLFSITEFFGSIFYINAFLSIAIL